MRISKRYTDFDTWNTAAKKAGYTVRGPFTPSIGPQKLIYSAADSNGYVQADFDMNKNTGYVYTYSSIKKNPNNIRIVYNKLLGGWYVVRGPHQTPLNGRFNSKAEAQAWLNRGKKNPVDNFRRVVIKGDKFLVDSLFQDTGISHIFIERAGDNLVYDIYRKHINKLSTLLNKHPELEGRFTKPKKIETLKQHDRRINREYKKSLRTVQEILKKKNPVKKYKRQLSVPEKHQLKIAYQTLKMSDAGARIMGGPNKEQAREIIKRLTGKTMKENPIKIRSSHSRAIFTKFIPATNFKPARIKAYDKVGGGKVNSIIISQPLNMDHNEAHLFAAKKLADKMNWHGKLVCGGTETGFVCVFEKHESEPPRKNPKFKHRKTARAFDARSIRNVSKGGKKTRKKNPARYYIFRKHKGIRYYLTVSDVPYKFDSIKNLARYFVDKKDAVSLAEKIATQFNIRLFVGS